MWPFSTRQWQLTAPEHEARGHCNRITAWLGGHELWFESADAILAPTPEAFLSPALFGALDLNRKIRSTQQIDPLWLQNTRHLPAIYSDWWDYRADYPLSGYSKTSTTQPPESSIGAFFTLGVDSFHTLLTRGEELQTLIYVQGFDVALKDRARMQAVLASLEQVARHFGKRLISVRTNLRQHPALRRTPWNRMHGPALAGIAHLLRDELGRVVIPSTFGPDQPIPWGSHPLTDPLWSGSAMTLDHDTPLRRVDKIRQLAGNSLVQKHLRVCWEHRSPVLNCSRCEKCLRTMTTLAACGKLEQFPVFEQGAPLAQRIDNLDPLKPTSSWPSIEREGLPLDVAAAVAGLLERSGHWDCQVSQTDA
jgi:hypothetical protein